MSSCGSRARISAPSVPRPKDSETSCVATAASARFPTAFGPEKTELQVTLILTPTTLVVMNDARRAVHRLVNRRWPTPEEVEPNRLRNGIPVPESAPEGAPGGGGLETVPEGPL